MAFIMACPNFKKGLKMVSRHLGVKLHHAQPDPLLYCSYPSKSTKQNKEKKKKHNFAKLSRTHKNTIFHIQGNIRYHQGNDRKGALIIILGK
jgi:hypothetical protein